jgi:hypothetical protein
LSSAPTPVPNQPLHFSVPVAGPTNQPTNIILMPFYDLHHQRYTIYWQTR